MASDPKVFFAAERTLLAWVRSGIAVMALGFVVAKFGLFLSLLSASYESRNVLDPNNVISNIFGIMLIIVGVATILGAQLNHHLYVKTLPSEDVPKLAISWLASLLAISIGTIGIALTGYLLLL